MVYRHVACPYRRSLLVCAAALRVVALAAHGDTRAWASDPPAAKVPAGYQTLAAALTDARPPAGDGIALAVDAENIKLPQADAGAEEDQPLAPRATITRIADRFGRVVHRFGSMTALAPPTMVLIYTPSAAPNIYEGMPPEDVLTLLLASLNASQWQEITSEQGLPASSMSTRDQKMLMAALLPQGKLNVAPYYYQFRPDYKPEDIRDLSADLPQARLRIDNTFAIQFPSRDNINIFFGSGDIPPAPGGAQRYRIVTVATTAAPRIAFMGRRYAKWCRTAKRRGNCHTTIHE